MDRDDPRAVAFRAAVEAGDAAGLRSLVERSPELGEVLDEPWFAFGAPALVDAAGRADRDVVDALLDLGADIDARSVWEAGPYSALHRTLDGPTPETLALAEHLVERGATLDLHAAAGMGRLDVLARILDAEPARVSEPGPDGATPLHLARNVDVAAFLLERGAEIDKRCVDHSSTPAMWAVQGREEVTRLLVERGARADLFMAAVLDDVALAERILADEPSAIEARVGFNISHEHIGFGNKYVWALGFADTPVQVAHERGSTAVHRFLLERSSGATRLVQACRRGDLDEARRLLTEDPELASSLSPHDVHRVLRAGPEAARLALAHGVDPDALDDDMGATAMHWAAFHGERATVELLFERGARVTIRERTYGGTPLGWANHGGHPEIVEWLAARARLDLVDACWLGNTERVREILEEDPGAATRTGERSPLRTAAWFGHLEIARLLLARGADPRIPDPETGKSAIDVARERGHREMVALLER